MYTKELLDKIFSRLKEEDCFKEFKLKRNENKFVRETAGGFEDFGFDHYETVRSHENPELGLNMCLYFDIRYDILHTWFEQYGLQDIKFQKAAFSFAYAPKDTGMHDNSFFSYRGDDFEISYRRFLNEIVTGADYFFNRVNTLKKCYENYIVPVIKNGVSALPDGGGPRIFRYLALTRIVAPENYPLVKSMIMQQVDFMLKQKEPNIVQYRHNTVPEICAFLESIDFRGVNIN